jgi:hypothetical protein
MRRFGVLVLIAFIASAGIGVSYASLNGGYVTDGFPSCYCDVAFVGSVTAYDNEVTKFIGEVDAWLIDDYNDGLYNGIWVEITHAYPCYEVYIDFTVINAGKNPINIDGLAPGGYDPSAMAVSLTGDISTTGSLPAGNTVDGTLAITVLNGALQNGEYEFTIDLGFYNVECPQTTLVDTVYVPANYPEPTYSSINLVDGIDYILVATGIASAGDTIDFDAKYSITNRIQGDTWTDVVTGYESYGPTLLDLFVNGNPGDWGVYNADHDYECTITGDGSQVELWIYDIYYPNNAGSLRVNIYELS